MWGRRRVAARTVHALEEEVSRLRAEVDALKDADEPVTRRQLLRRVGTAAAAGLGLAVADEMLNPVPAGAAGPIAGDSNNITAAVSGTSNGGVSGGFGVSGFVTSAQNPSAAVYGNTVGTGTAMWGEVNNTNNVGSGVYARTNTGNFDGTALKASSAGVGGSAVHAENTNNTNSSPAIFAVTVGTGSAMVAENNSTSQATVDAENGAASGISVRGSSPSGIGVYGTSSQSTGVLGELTGAASPGTAVRGQTAGTGVGVNGAITHPTSPNAAVLGQTGSSSTFSVGVHGSAQSGTGVRGNGRIGVYGTSTNTYGVQGEIIGASDAGTAVYGLTAGTGFAVHGSITNTSSVNAAVFGSTLSTSPTTAGVRGGTNFASAGSGVHGVTDSTNSGGVGVRASSVANGAKALYAENTAASSTQYVMHARQAGPGPVFLAENANTGSTTPVIEARHFGTGTALLGTTGSNADPAMRAINTLNGTGLQANSVGGAAVRGDATTGKGVLGASNSNTGVSGTSQSGPGVEASSGSGPQLRISPGSTLPVGTRPVGDVFLDQNGNLFLVKVEGPSPGAWMRVGFNPIDPVRIVDTRSGPPLNHGQELLVTIIGAAGIPAGASAVVLNVTAVSPSAGGFLSVYPANLTYSVGSPPTFSNVNFVGGNPPVPNLVQVKIAPVGTTNAGKIKVFHFAAGGTCHVLVDVAGFYS